MTFVQNDMKRARKGLTGLPRALRTRLEKVSNRLGPYGVRVAQSLVARDTGRTASSIRYVTGTTRGARGTVFELRVYVHAETRDEAIRTFVTEFGRGHGRAGARARGNLPARQFLRPSRELVAKRARGAFSRAMREAARQAIGG